MTELSNRVLLSISLVIGSVGALDFFISQEWDLLAVFLLSIVVQLMLWIRQRAHRLAVTLRADVAYWVEGHAQQTGEPFDDVLDRAVAWHRASLFRDVDVTQ